MDYNDESAKKLQQIYVGLGGSSTFIYWNPRIVEAAKRLAEQARASAFNDEMLDDIISLSESGCMDAHWAREVGEDGIEERRAWKKSLKNYFELNCKSEAEIRAAERKELMKELATWLQKEAKDTIWMYDGCTLWDALAIKFKDFPQDYNKFLDELEASESVALRGNKPPISAEISGSLGAKGFGLKGDGKPADKTITTAQETQEPANPKPEKPEFEIDEHERKVYQGTKPEKPKVIDKKHKV